MVDKSGNYCHTGNNAVTTRKFRFWEKDGHLYGKSVVVVVVGVGGSVSVAEVQDHLQAPPCLPHPEQVKHVEKASRKTKKKKQPWQH